MSDLYCKFCGNMHSDVLYPKFCNTCCETTWLNPWPVAVLLQPVQVNNEKNNGARLGILLGRRTIHPGKGLWGLPGGFIDPKDVSVEAAAAREFFEETGLTVPVNEIKIVSSMSDGRHLLIFCEAERRLAGWQIESFQPNSECDALRVAFAREELCFESHTKALSSWFDV